MLNSGVSTLWFKFHEPFLSHVFHYFNPKLTPHCLLLLFLFYTNLGGLSDLQDQMGLKVEHGYSIHMHVHKVTNCN